MKSLVNEQKRFFATVIVKYMEKTRDVSRPHFSEHIIFASPTALYKIEVLLWYH